MKRILSFLIGVLFLASSCSTYFPDAKFHPEYQGVDQRLQGLVNEYMFLSAQKHLTFKHKVTMGFKKIKSGKVVGVCTFGNGWREIDFDIDFWNNNPPSSRLALVFHELTHCYCGRIHDYGAAKQYPPTEAGRIEEALEWRKRGGPKPGRFDDACPVSLMYPAVVDSNCLMSHFSDYMDEMFDRCHPY